MTVASELQRNSSLPISDIRILIGYDCEATFCHLFKQYVRISASAFRNSNNHFPAKNVTFVLIIKVKFIFI